MRTAVIVQARGGSTRLPGKVLLDVAGKPVLQHVLERCRAIPGADLVVCAVPDKPASKPLEEIATHCGAVIFRGSEQDVLARYHGAALAARADVVMRVTSDCPLIDPEICGEVLALRAQTGSDYAANNMPPSYPHGLDCEAFSFAALACAAEQALSVEDREHVTPWLRRAEGIRRVNLSSGVPTLAAHRWTLDYPEDIAFLRALGEELVDISTARMCDIFQALDRRPEIGYINASRRVR